MLRWQAWEERVGPATCWSSGQRHQANCPVLSWQLGLEQAGPHPSRLRQAGQGLAQAREK